MTEQVKCAQCKVPVKGPADPNDDSVFTCPSCGRSDTYQAIIKEIEASSAHQVEDKFASDMERIARTSEHMQVRRSGPPQKKPRFFVDLNL